MKKKAWETPPHLRDRRGDIEQLKAMVAERNHRIEGMLTDLQRATAMAQSAHSEMDKMRRNAQRYLALRKKGAVIMDDECKHLQGADMDAYLDKDDFATSFMAMVEERVAEMARKAVADKLQTVSLTQGDTLTIHLDNITLTAT